MTGRTRSTKLIRIVSALLLAIGVLATTAIEASAAKGGHSLSCTNLGWDNLGWDCLAKK